MQTDKKKIYKWILPKGFQTSDISANLEFFCLYSIDKINSKIPD